MSLTREQAIGVMDDRLKRGLRAVVHCYPTSPLASEEFFYVECDAYREATVDDLVALDAVGEAHGAQLLVRSPNITDRFSNVVVIAFLGRATSKYARPKRGT